MRVLSEISGLNQSYLKNITFAFLAKRWNPIVKAYSVTCLVAAYSLALGTILSGCATAPPVIYPHTAEHTSALRVAEIMELQSGKELQGFKGGKEFSEMALEALKDSGLTDAEIREGALAVAREYCCGGPAEAQNVVLLFVPQGLPVEPGDIVEVKMGEAPTRGKRGRANIAIKVREKHYGSEMPKWGSSPSRVNRSCRWVPENPDLWNRVLYCDWMEDEGWTEYKGFWNTWMKPEP
jgi:hypothetical protein